MTKQYMPEQYIIQQVAIHYTTSNSRIQLSIELVLHDTTLQWIKCLSVLLKPIVTKHNKVIEQAHASRFYQLLYIRSI